MNEDSIDFLFSVSAWLLQSGRVKDPVETELVLPNDAFFPVATGDAKRAARELFELCREHAGLSEWPVELQHEGGGSALSALRGVPHDSVAGAASSGLLIGGSSEEPVYAVTYVDDDVRSPLGYLASVAGQLGAMVVSTIAAEPPGGEDAVAYAADVASVFLGLGVIVTNGAFVFEQFQEVNTHGWWYQRRGWLSQAELAYALAIHSVLADRAPRHVARHLSVGPRATFKAAVKDIRRRQRHRMARLRGVPPESVGGLEYAVPASGRLSAPD